MLTDLNGPEPRLAAPPSEPSGIRLGVWHPDQALASLGDHILVTEEVHCGIQTLPGRGMAPFPEVARSRLRPTGPTALCRAVRTYSIVSRVGFAPGLAYLGRGAFGTCAFLVIIRSHLVDASFHPMRGSKPCP